MSCCSESRDDSERSRNGRLGDSHVLEAVCSAVEILARQIYFRSPRLMRWYDGRRRKAGHKQHAQIEDLREKVAASGFGPSRLVMVHASTRGMSIERSRHVTNDAVGVAALLVSELLALSGDRGTLVMPTHPLYPRDPGYHAAVDKSDLVLTYDPIKTRTTVGLVNEIFRLCPGVLRTAHPLQCVSAIGPGAEDLLNNNLNETKPLPHGVHSAYYRICKANGTVISIGFPLIECCTFIHSAEDSRDQEWPVRDFFRERRFIVRLNGDERDWTVRERRPLFARSYCEGQLHRDLLREGLLHEGTAGGIRVDWASAGDVYEFLMHRNRGNSYPFFLPRLAKIGGRSWG